ncbi:plasmalemma vesicle-associated protein isoform X1 [Falco rusticolus]|uniref:plasmalemma vesicle-associated protein isoform X1 n=2 Tax=Falco peregrinus TaxID=8954 RepID=UPI00067870B5|nr:plasmalemma vesicle-associated protein isoform X1 [Falco peregrinus]XP_005444406.2 plasmalemma vesicle-associated protein isoform X1 [Falco cherrug]XP_037239476.1 plasmalemma vesicle-associated protein isoform X1 [Falco rusticolus]
MEKSSYPMAKFGLEAKEAMPKRDCGFYVKYIFLFTSLIQFLIILGLVLFMVYGNAQAGTDTHLRLLEQQLQDRYNKIITLSGRNLNLTRTLNATLKEKQGLQVLTQKVQRDLDKCNSTQAPNSINTEIMKMIIFLQKTKLDECQMNRSRIDANCSAERVLLQHQLDQKTLAKKEVEEKCRQVDAMLTKATQEQENCQWELLTTKAIYKPTKSNLELLKRECSSLKSDMNYIFQRIKDMVSPYSCSAVHEQISRLTQRTEELFLRQQEWETNYMEKSFCDMNLVQCHTNCSKEKQELDKQLQKVEAQLKGGQEEKKKLLAEKEQLRKELEEKSRAAAQAVYFKEQLNICMGSKIDTFFDITGSRVPGSSGRLGPFTSTGSYMDALRNQRIFGNMGKINMEEIQRMAQKITEQFASALKDPSS